ncbi:MAG: hypothetical protein ACFE9Z_13485 [Promethearchaeota archaeon]
MTESSYYDWELSQKIKPKYNKKKKKDCNEIGISTDDFKKFVKLWRSKNIIF